MEHKGFVDLDFVKLDIARNERRGFPEIVYAPPKTHLQLKKIIKEFRKHTDSLVISRLDYKKYQAIKNTSGALKYFRQARLGFIGKSLKPVRGHVLIITAGTADIPVAQEAAVFLELCGNYVERLYDVGVAGVHRLEHFKDKLKRARVIIVIAGMEAALLSIVSGLSRAPLIGVPTSVGYGAAFKGLSALLGMLNSCSPGSVIVNIDNGLGAGYFANLINK
ncbi:MAG: nickel pincer cofactor biosynthesis protein LarB [Candidatus Omnitrophica bacterium]|nr:nickel pincer cofactor biosynthesis protein LarB [Candidatus Omnitrophota bacterium]